MTTSPAPDAAIRFGGSPASRWRTPARTQAIVVGAALVVAIVVGLLTTGHAFLSIEIVVGIVILCLVATDIRILPIFLILTLFTESVEVSNGLRIGRIAAVMALALVAYYLLTHGRRDLRPSALLLTSAAYGVWILLSLYWASAPSYVYDTFFRYAIAAAYMLAFAVLVRSRQQLSWIFTTLATGAFIFGLASFAGYVTSVDTYSISTDPAALEATARGLQGDHNFFAVYQVVSLPAALALASLARRASSLAFYYSVVAVIVLSVVSSLSRTGLISLAAVVLATLVLPRRMFFTRASQKVTYAFALGVAALLVMLAGAAPFIHRAVTIFKEHGVSGARGSGRVDIWHAAWHGFRDHEFIGLGAGNFRARVVDLLQSTPGVNNISGNTRNTGRYVHNMYLENLTELGIVGLIVFMLLLALTVRTLLRSRARARATGDIAVERFVIALLVTLVGFAIAGFFLSAELGKPLWIIIGLALAIEVMMRERDSLGPGSDPDVPALEAAPDVSSLNAARGV